MLRRKIVVTGYGAVSPFGLGANVLWDALVSGRSAVANSERMELAGLRSKLCAEVGDLPSKEIPRQFRRTMSRMSQFAYLAAREALEWPACPRECSVAAAWG